MRGAKLGCGQSLKRTYQLVEITKGSNPCTKARIEHGKRIRASLRQEELAPIPLYAQVGMLLALGENLLDTIPVDRVGKFRKDFQDALLRDCPREIAKIEETGSLTDEDKGAMLKAARRVSNLSADTPKKRTVR